MKTLVPLAIQLFCVAAIFAAGYYTACMRAQLDRQMLYFEPAAASVGKVVQLEAIRNEKVRSHRIQAVYVCDKV